MSRGLSNFNPGNIRQSPTKYMGEVRPSKDKAFKQFSTMAWGYRAMFVLLHTYSKNGYKTIRQMISRYAPPIENYTDRYIDFVADNALLSPDVPLDTTDHDTMLLVVSAMSRMENGIPAVIKDVEQGWQLFVKHRP